MTRLFRYKSCSLGVDYSGSYPMPPPRFSPTCHKIHKQDEEFDEVEEEEEEEEEEETEEEEEEDDDEYDDGYDNDVEYSQGMTMTPFGTYKSSSNTKTITESGGSDSQFSVVAMVAAALRKSLVTCSVAATDDHDDDDHVDIGWPTDVRHVSHVTFDRFHGFLGLPMELQPHLPPKPPSASASVFGVSAQSMQCSYDQRGNSVPTILIRMQSRLYSEGGLRAEGIFRINAENSQEEHVRNQLNRGIVPRGIDVHCLSGLIKAWFRELPSGVLDSLTPEQVMHCNTEEDCSSLIALLPPTEHALLDWAINLMADVVQNEHQNKMNARNIAMVFAPNMTQMADPLTALIHAVQVMNLLKTLIMKTVREREESAGNNTLLPLPTKCAGSIENMECSHQPSVTKEKAPDKPVVSGIDCSTTLRSATLERLECDNNNNNKNKSFDYRSNSDSGKKIKTNTGGSASPPMRKKQSLALERFKDEDENENVESEGILNRLSLRRGMQRLRQHPVFHFTKTVKKVGS